MGGKDFKRERGEKISGRLNRQRGGKILGRRREKILGGKGLRGETGGSQPGKGGKDRREEKGEDLKKISGGKMP